MNKYKCCAARGKIFRGRASSFIYVLEAEKVLAGLGAIDPRQRSHVLISKLESSLDKKSRDPALRSVVCQAFHAHPFTSKEVDEVANLTTTPYTLVGAQNLAEQVIRSVRRKFSGVSKLTEQPLCMFGYLLVG